MLVLLLLNILEPFYSLMTVANTQTHLKMLLCISAIISQLFKVIALAKCVLTILELNWNQCFGGMKTN